MTSWICTRTTRTSSRNRIIEKHRSFRFWWLKIWNQRTSAENRVRISPITCRPTRNETWRQSCRKTSSVRLREGGRARREGGSQSNSERCWSETLENKLFSIFFAIDNLSASGRFRSRMVLCCQDVPSKVKKYSYKRFTEHVYTEHSYYHTQMPWNPNKSHTCWCSYPITNWNRSHFRTWNTVLGSSLCNYGKLN